MTALPIMAENGITLLFLPQSQAGSADLNPSSSERSRRGYHLPLKPASVADVPIPELPLHTPGVGSGGRGACPVSGMYRGHLRCQARLLAGPLFLGNLAPSQPLPDGWLG